MSIRKFTIKVIKAEERGYTGCCMELPAAISEGETIKELETNMKEAVTLVLEETKNDQKIIIEIPN